MRSTTPWPLLACCATTWRWGLSGARSRWLGPARSLRLAGSPAGTGTRQGLGPASSVSRRAPRPVLSEPGPSPSPRGRPALDQGHRGGCRRSVPDRGLTSPTRTAFSSRRLGYGLSRLEEKYVLGGKRSPRFSRPCPGRLLHIARDVSPRGCPHGRSPTARGAPRLIDWHPALAQQVTTTAPSRDPRGAHASGEIAQASAASSPRETRNPSSSTATPETAVTRTVASSSTRSRAVCRSRRRERETTSA